MKLLGREIPLGMSIGAYTPGDIHSFVAQGFTHFELPLSAKFGGRNDIEKVVAPAKAYAEAIAREGMKPWSMHLPFGGEWDISVTDENERSLTIAALKRVIDASHDVGAKVYVIHGSAEPIAPDVRAARAAQSVTSLRELHQYAQALGMELALEDLPRTCLANSTDDIARLSEAAGVPICFDVNHLLIDTHEKFIDTLAHRIITTHLSDYDRIDEKHWLPGLGVVPWRLIVEKLSDAGYKGPFLFELSSYPYTAAEIVSAFKQAVEG